MKDLVKGILIITVPLGIACLISIIKTVVEVCITYKPEKKVHAPPAPPEPPVPTSLNDPQSERQYLTDIDL